MAHTDLSGQSVALWVTRAHLRRTLGIASDPPAGLTKLAPPEGLWCIAGTVRGESPPGLWVEITAIVPAGGPNIATEMLGAQTLTYLVPWEHVSAASLSEQPPPVPLWGVRPKWPEPSWPRPSSRS